MEEPHEKTNTMKTNTEITQKQKRLLAEMPDAAGNGLMDRRALLGRGLLLAGAAGTGFGASLTSAGAEPLPTDPWSLAPGTAIPPYGQPMKYESKVVRTLTNPKNEPRTSQGRTPHQHLAGTITPAGPCPLRGVAYRLPGHRSGQASPGYPRIGETAAGL